MTIAQSLGKCQYRRPFYYNATFLLTNTELEEEFYNMCTNGGINGLKGHRSVGSYRASMYNAMPFNSVQTLVEIMNELERKDSKYLPTMASHKQELIL